MARDLVMRDETRLTRFEQLRPLSPITASTRPPYDITAGRTTVHQHTLSQHEILSIAIAVYSCICCSYRTSKGPSDRPPGTPLDRRGARRVPHRAVPRRDEMGNRGGKMGTAPSMFSPVIYSETVYTVYEIIVGRQD